MNSGISQGFIYHVSQDRIQFLDDIRQGCRKRLKAIESI